MYRIGNGFDVHGFTNGDHIVLGGVKIPHDRAFKAHSDGDVLIHALCDALLGALALGDIGQHFPDNRDQFKNIDSRLLLRNVIEKIRNEGFTLVNCDNTIVAETPKMAGHVDAMRTNLAQDLRVAKQFVSVKATTTENLGFTGRKEGIAVYSSVLLAMVAD